MTQTGLLCFRASNRVLYFFYLESTGIILSRQETTKALIRLRGCPGLSELLLFAYGIHRFSHDNAQLS